MFAQTPFDKVLGASNLGMLKYEWIWRKEAGTGFLNAKKAPLKDHENVLVFYDKPPRYYPQMRTGFKPYKCTKGGETSNYNASGIVTTESDGSRYPLTVLDFPRDKDKVHPTQKPVPLMEYLIRTYTTKGDTVLDNTMGSGTTGVACENTGRRFIGIERDPTYFDVAVGRVAGASMFGLQDMDSAHIRPTGPAVGANPLISLPETGRRDWTRTNLDGDSRGLQGEKANGTDPQ